MMAHCVRRGCGTNSKQTLSHSHRIANAHRILICCAFAARMLQPNMKGYGTKSDYDRKPDSTQEY
jgi:hypothetical protein